MINEARRPPQQRLVMAIGRRGGFSNGTYLFPKNEPPVLIDESLTLRVGSYAQSRSASEPGLSTQAQIPCSRNEIPCSVKKIPCSFL